MFLILPFWKCGVISRRRGRDVINNTISVVAKDQHTKFIACTSLPGDVESKVTVLRNSRSELHVSLVSTLLIKFAGDIV